MIIIVQGKAILPYTTTGVIGKVLSQGYRPFSVELITVAAAADPQIAAGIIKIHALNSRGGYFDDVLITIATGSGVIARLRASKPVPCIVRVPIMARVREIVPDNIPGPVEVRC
jgi:hypothetical protein